MPQAIPFIVEAAASAAGLSAVTVAALTLASALAVGIYEEQQGKKDARDAFNRSLQDRLATLRSGTSSRKYMLGTARSGGTLMYAETVGEFREALDMVIAFAANECEIVDWFIGDDLVDANSFPGPKYGYASFIPFTAPFTVTGPTASVSLDVPASFDVHATWRQDGLAGEAFVDLVSATQVDVSGLPVGVSELTLCYQAFQADKLRGQFKSGTTTQTVTNWDGYSTPAWTSNHRLLGVAHTRTLMIWDQNIFSNGAPAISIVGRGRAVSGYSFFDPRTSSNPVTTFNPAILARWWMTLPRSLGGCGIPADWIDDNFVSAAANICDEMVAVRTLDGLSFTTIPRYSCDTVLSTDVAPLDNLKIILSAMAGRYAFTGGKYRIFAGAFRPSAITLTDKDVVGTKPISVNTASISDTPPNIVTARFADATQGYVESSPKPVSNSAYIASDGYESPFDLALQASTDPRRSQYLMGIALEEKRPAFGVALSVLGIGEDIGLLDTVQLNLINRPSYTGRTFVVERVVDNWDGTFDLSLSEIRPQTWALDPTTWTPVTPVVPTDNSYLWNPPAPGNFQVAALTPTTLPDGSAVTRVQLNWDAIPPAGAVPGSYIELRYRLTGGDWIDAGKVSGDSTGTVVTAALIDQEVYQFEARFVNGVGALSSWSDAFTQVDGTPLPTPLALRLRASSIVFRVPQSGNALPVSINLDAVRSGGLAASAVWSTSPTVTLGGSGDNRTLAYSAMGANDSVQVTVTVTQSAVAYQDTVTVVKVFDGASSSPDLTAPPTPTGLSVQAFLVSIVVTWTAPSYTQGHGNDATVIYAAPVPSSGPQPTFAQATPVGSSSSTAFIFTTTTGSTWAFWIRFQSRDGVLSAAPAGGTNGVQATTGLIGGANLAPLLIDASKLADGSVTASKLAAQAVDATKLAAGIEAITIVTGALPGSYAGSSVYRTTDNKLYRWNGATYTAQTAAADIAGQLSDSQIAAIAAAKITGAIASTQIADGSISTPKIAAGAVVAANIAADTITATQIAVGAIGVSELAANAVTANALAANSVIAGKISAAAVAAQQIAAGAITTDKLLVTGRGAALNDDPACSDASAWTIIGGVFPQFVTISDGIAGTTTMRSASGTTSYVYSRLFPFDPAKTYRVRGRVRNVGSNGVLYLGPFYFDSNNSLISALWVAASASGVPAGFTEFSGLFGAGTANPLPSNARTIALAIAFNYTATTGYMEAQDLRIEEAFGSSLIVDGAITAAKLAANSIVVGTAAIQNGAIINAMIANGAIDSAKIADATITSAKIVDGSITTADIGDAQITSAKIADANITSAKIGTAAITSAKIGDLEVNSAKIANLTIGTGKLADNAVTGSGSATSSSGGSSTALAFNYTSQGGVLLILASINVGNDNGSTTVGASVRVDGSPIDSVAFNGISGNAAIGGRAAFTLVRVLSPGSHSFSLIADPTWTSANLIVIEFKK